MPVGGLATEPSTSPGTVRSPPAGLFPCSLTSAESCTIVTTSIRRPNSPVTTRHATGPSLSPLSVIHEKPGHSTKSSRPPRRVHTRIVTQDAPSPVQVSYKEAFRRFASRLRSPMPPILPSARALQTLPQLCQVGVRWTSLDVCDHVRVANPFQNQISRYRLTPTCIGCEIGRSAPAFALARSDFASPAPPSHSAVPGSEPYCQTRAPLCTFDPLGA